MAPHLWNYMQAAHTPGRWQGDGFGESPKASQPVGQLVRALSLVKVVQSA